MQREVLRELEEREITSEKYELLLSLERNHQGKVSFERFCSLAFQKEYPAPDSYSRFDHHKCNVCQIDIVPKSEGTQLSHCGHVVHKLCLEDLFHIAPAPEE